MTTQSRQWRHVLVIWAVLMAIAVGSVVLLNRNALRVLHWLEYVEASRYNKATVLYWEAEKNAAVALAKLPSDGITTPVLSLEDPHLSSAISLLDRATNLDPRAEFAPDREPHFILMGDLYGAAGQQARQFISYGQAALTQSDFAGAENYAKRASNSAESDQPGVAYFQAQVYYRTNRLDEATTQLQTLITKPNPPAGALALYANLLQRQSNTDEALQHYKAAVAAAPRQVTYRKDYAGALTALGREEEALQVYDEGLDTGWDDGNYLHLYGELLRRHNQLDRALEILLQAEKVEPTSGDVQLSIARVYKVLGKKRYAARHLQRAVTLKPEFQDKLLQ